MTHRFSPACMACLMNCIDEAMQFLEAMTRKNTRRPKYGPVVTVVTTGGESDRARGALDQPWQELAEAAGGLTAVAHGVFFFVGEFGGGAAAFGDEKERIVTESARPAWRIGNVPVPTALSDDRRRIVGPIHEH